MNVSPYSTAATAAQRAKCAQVHASQRLAYARRMAYRALRAGCPWFPSLHAWAVAKSAAIADTSAYGPRTYEIAA